MARCAAWRRHDSSRVGSSVRSVPDRTSCWMRSTTSAWPACAKSAMSSRPSRMFSSRMLDMGPSAAGYAAHVELRPQNNSTASTHAREQAGSGGALKDPSPLAAPLRHAQSEQRGTAVVYGTVTHAKSPGHVIGSKFTRWVELMRETGRRPVWSAQISTA